MVGRHHATQPSLPATSELPRPSTGLRTAGSGRKSECCGWCSWGAEFDRVGNWHGLCLCGCERHQHRDRHQITNLCRQVKIVGAGRATVHCFMVGSYVFFVLKKLLLRSHGRRYQGSRGEIPRLVCHHRGRRDLGGPLTGPQQYRACQMSWVRQTSVRTILSAYGL